MLLSPVAGSSREDAGVAKHHSWERPVGSIARFARFLA